jgi:hypothetical protein
MPVFIYYNHFISSCGCGRSHIRLQVDLVAPPPTTTHTLLRSTQNDYKRKVATSGSILVHLQANRKHAARNGPRRGRRATHTDHGQVRTREGCAAIGCLQPTHPPRRRNRNDTVTKRASGRHAQSTLLPDCGRPRAPSMKSACGFRTEPRMPPFPFANLAPRVPVASTS